jgi:NADH-quinone oxidoreductase subunit L
VADPALLAVGASIGGPLVATAACALAALLAPTVPERVVVRLSTAGLVASLAGSLVTAARWAAHPVPTDVEVGPWLVMGGYEVPVVFHLDEVSAVFSLLAALLTALTAAFSATYLHREPGFLRFFVLLGLFAGGVQLVALAGALDLFFAGWELLGLSSTLFIGFYKDRTEPVRSSLRAFATYRACDVGFFLGIVAVHELLGSTRLSVMEGAAALSLGERTLVAALFLLPALGKSAQLPFSSWLPRAMEGPTPSSALFYGSLSVHAGLYLLLRTHPLLDAAEPIEALGVVLGLLTAVYGALVARVQTDAKSTLAFATLGQTGLILAEIAAGFTTLALVHLVGHALLRVGQYLRAPSAVHDAHHRGHTEPRPAWWERAASPALRRRVFTWSLHRFRLDEWTDRVVRPLLWAADRWNALDARMSAAVSLDGRDGRAK